MTHRAGKETTEGAHRARAKISQTARSAPKPPTCQRVGSGVRRQTKLGRQAREESHAKERESERLELLPLRTCCRRCRTSCAAAADSAQTHKRTQAAWSKKPHTDNTEWAFADAKAQQPDDEPQGTSNVGQGTLEGVITTTLHSHLGVNDGVADRALLDA